jgi:hypothetical protein
MGNLALTLSGFTHAINDGTILHPLVGLFFGGSLQFLIPFHDGVHDLLVKLFISHAIGFRGQRLRHRFNLFTGLRLVVAKPNVQLGKLIDGFLAHAPLQAGKQIHFTLNEGLHDLLP